MAGIIGGWETAGCEFARTPATVTRGGRTLPATPPELAAAMQRVDSGARSAHAGSYAGIEVDQPNVRAIVYRVPDAALDDFIRNAARNTCVQVRDARYSSEELAVWQRVLEADLPAWRYRGVRISSVGARHDGAGLEIGTPDLDNTRYELRLHYGQAAPLIFVATGPVATSPTAGFPLAPQPGG